MRQDLGQNGVSRKLEIDEQFLTLLSQVQLLWENSNALTGDQKKTVPCKLHLHSHLCQKSSL